jgi:hypothetical protein
MLNLEDFEQRGALGYYYRRSASARRPGHAFVLRACAGCGRPCLARAHAPSSSGRFCSASCAKLGEQHPNWKGAAAGYTAAHQRVYQAHGRASSCAWGCQVSRYDWANLTGNLLDPDDYAAMCHRCHARFDAAVKIATTRPAGWNWSPWRGVLDLRNSPAQTEACRG